MTDQAKRSWLRLHLATAIIAMPFAAILAGLSLFPKGFSNFRWEHAYGWPLVFYRAVLMRNGTWQVDPINWESASYDGWIAMVSIVGIVLIAEFLIRRREGRKP